MLVCLSYGHVNLKNIIVCILLYLFIIALFIFNHGLFTLVLIFVKIFEYFMIQINYRIKVAFYELFYDTFVGGNCIASTKLTKQN